ncbi:MAG: protease B, partial [Chloroflexi bacterium]|nr:protease B [Chloroflexota bacterium]
VCVAAVHAGAITTDGGVIRVTMLEGQESYTGSERNGVTTQDYGSWGGSFSVEPFTQPE